MRQKFGLANLKSLVVGMFVWVVACVLDFRVVPMAAQNHSAWHLSCRATERVLRQDSVSARTQRGTAPVKQARPIWSIEESLV
jgi:hypothetical protein